MSEQRGTTAHVSLRQLFNAQPKAEAEAGQSNGLTEAGPIGGKMYHVYLNDKPPTTMFIPDIAVYMDRFFHGAEYRVDEERGEIHTTASAVQLLEIKEYRQRYIVGD